MYAVIVKTIEKGRLSTCASERTVLFGGRGGGLKLRKFGVIVKGVPYGETTTKNRG